VFAYIRRNKAMTRAVIGLLTLLLSPNSFSHAIALSESDQFRSNLSPQIQINSIEFIEKYKTMAICRLVEKNSNISTIADTIALLNINEDVFRNIRFRIISPGEIIIEVPEEGVAVRYYDPSMASGILPFSDVKRLVSVAINQNLHRQIIHKKVVLSDSNVSFGVDSNKKNLLGEIKDTAELLSFQNANIVFEKNKQLEQWCFRQSGQYVPVSDVICTKLSERLKSEGKTGILIAFRKDASASQVQKALLDIILKDGQSVEQSFKNRGISATYEFKKVLLVAPYGDTFGNPLKKTQPHLGTELLAYVANREINDVDVRVYNPNLGSKDGLYEFIKNESKDRSFDLIGFSFIQAVMKASLEMLCKVREVDPNTLLLLGGHDVGKMSEEFFQAVPCDLAVKADGMAFIEILSKISSSNSREQNLSRLKGLPDVIIVRDQIVSSPNTTKSLSKLGMQHYPEFMEDIPYKERDLTHGKKYYSGSDNQGQRPIRCDDIGRKTLRVALSDRCKGKCIFCGAYRTGNKPPPVTKVMDFLRSNFSGHDSIHFQSNDFLFDLEYAKELCNELIKSEWQTVPKKMVSRVDEVTPEILELLSDAGFVDISYGIESFDDTVLKMLKKETTGQDNEKAIEGALNAGLKPGIGLIFFTPYSTVTSALDTLNKCVEYVDKGAYLNIVRDINIHFGSPISKMDEIIEFEQIDFPSMKKTFTYPKIAKVMDPELDIIRKRTLEILEKVKQQSGIPAQYEDSFTIESLLFLKAFLIAYTNNHPEDVVNERMMKKIEGALRSAVFREMKSTIGVVKSVEGVQYFNNSKIPARGQALLDLDSYIRGRFPQEFIKFLDEKDIIIELHSGPQSYTTQYLEDLKYLGYRVSELSGSYKGHQKYYLIEQEGEKKVIISSIQGESRELAVVQSLEYFKYPWDKVFKREFKYNLRKILDVSLFNYRGRIEDAIIAYDVDEVVDSLMGVEFGIKKIERYKTDFLDCAIIERKNGKKILIQEAGYTNGRHIKDIVEYFILDEESGGLGIKNITLSATCGAISDEVKVNDIIIPLEAYLYNDNMKFEKVQGVNNVVNLEGFDKLVDPAIQVHGMPIFTIPTVMSGSQEIFKYVNSHGNGAIELELAHLYKLLSKYPDIRCSVFYEVSDKPSIAGEDGESLGDNIPGLNNPDKREIFLKAFTKYFLDSDESNAVKHKKGTSLTEVADAIEKDLDEIMQGADKYRMKHVRLAIDSFKKFLKGREGFDFLYKNISNQIVAKKTYDKEQYFQLLDELLMIYGKLNTKEKEALLIAVILHDNRLVSGVKPMDHYRLSAEEVEPILKKYGVNDKQIISNIKDIVYFHGFSSDYGMQWLPSDMKGLSSRSKGLRAQELIITCVDTLAKMTREEPYLPDNILSAQFLQELLDVFKTSNLLEPEGFFKQRLLCAGMPRAFQISRAGLELDSKEFLYLENKFKNNSLEVTSIWSNNIRNKIFPLFLVIRKGNKGFDGLARAKKLYKVMTLFANVCNSYLKSGKVGRKTILSLDVEGEDFSDAFFEEILQNLENSGYFSMDTEGITEEEVMRELERTSWKSIFGLDLHFHEDTIILGATSDDAVVSFNKNHTNYLENTTGEEVLLNIDIDWAEFRESDEFIETKCSACDSKGTPSKKVIINGREFHIYQCEHDNWKWINPTLPKAFLDQIYSSPQYWKAPESVCIEVNGEPFPLLGYLDHGSPQRRERDKWISSIRVKEIEEARQLVFPKAERKRFLEIGFAAGDVLKEASKQGWEVLGIDISEGAVEGFVEKNPKMSANVRKANIETEAIPGEEFDVIAAYNLVEHLNDIPSFLQRTYQLLSDEGILAIDIPILPNSLPIYRSYVEHLHHPSLKGMEIILEKCGYELIKVVCPPIDSLGEALGMSNVSIFAKKKGKGLSVSDVEIMEFIPEKGKDSTYTKKKYEKIYGEEEPRFSSILSNMEEYLNYNLPYLNEMSGEDKPDILLRVPIDAIEGTGHHNIKDFLGTFIQIPNVYVEFYYMSGIGEETPSSVYATYGIKKKILPKGFKKTRLNTITLFPALRGEDIDDCAVLERLGGLDVKPTDTILSPIGMGNDAVGLVRGTLLGLRILGFAKELASDVELSNDSEFLGRVQLAVLETYKQVCYPSDRKELAGLTPHDIVALATGSTINDILIPLRKLIKLLPITPLDSEELRLIYEHAREVLLAV